VYQAAAQLSSPPRRRRRKHRGDTPYFLVEFLAPTLHGETLLSPDIQELLLNDSVARAEAESHVKGVSGCIHQGYPSLAAAQAAFDYASRRSWTRVMPARTSGASPAIPTLPSPVGLLDGPNPLHGTYTSTGAWYVVFSGITPGVYASLYVTCAILSLLSLTVPV
jgi:hypothetical protein